MLERGYIRGGVGGFDASDYSPIRLFIVQSDPGVGTVDFDRPKPGINPVCPSRLSESHASVGVRYEVFICFNRHNPIL